jgi:hypothetical protein
MWKEVVVACLVALSRRLLGLTEQNREKKNLTIAASTAEILTWNLQNTNQKRYRLK